MTLDTTAEIHQDRTVLLGARVNTDDAVSLRRTLLELGPGDIVVDASAVEFLGAAGLQVLLSAARTVRRDEKSLTLKDPSDAFLTSLARLGAGRGDLAPGGDYHLEVDGGGPTPKCRLKAGDLHSGHRPSVDVLFNSMEQFGSRVVGVILTGMGKDGAAGLGAIRNAGGTTIGQDEDSCVVYGMPRVAFETGAVQT
ncbi:MAG: chemotaxis protein CheB [Hyphomonas sp.]|uniref:chemotaxis protein CheB n=1 Tax=Hyphomonas sp. TaxID=87 RepID=UPI003528CD20